MLIQIVFFILILFGVAALTVDLSLVHLAQTQMQTAADAAALEGLRGRDAIDPNDSQTCAGFATTEGARRCAASEVAAASAVEPGFTLDAGTIPAATADPDLNPEQHLHPDKSGMYSLQLQPLQPNFTTGAAPSAQKDYGDLVSGCFDWMRPATEDSTFSATPYHRADFDKSCAAQQSFLARVRRTDERSVDVDQVSGVSSSGNSLPLIFGLSLPIQKSSTTDYSPRVHGITVRATAIADARPALRAGPPNPPVLGTAPFVLHDLFWSMCTADATPVILVVTTTLDPEVVCGATGHAGLLVQPVFTTVGATITPLSASPLASGTSYAPIYHDFPTPASVVVGFAQVSVVYPFPCTAGGTTCLQLTRTGSTLASQNASSVATSFPAPPAGVTISDILVLNKNLLGAGALLAPVLAR